MQGIHVFVFCFFKQNFHSQIPPQGDAVSDSLMLEEKNLKMSVLMFGFPLCKRVTNFLGRYVDFFYFFSLLTGHYRRGYSGHWFIHGNKETLTGCQLDTYKIITGLLSYCAAV